jgi:hypothetical protein
MVTLKGEAQQDLRFALCTSVHILRQNILNKNCTCKHNYNKILPIVSVTLHNFEHSPYWVYRR